MNAQLVRAAIVLGLLSVIGPLAIDMYLPALPAIAGDLNATAAAVQLAVYRLAWHHLTGEPLDRIRASFHHVAANVTVRPADLLDEPGLTALIRSVPFAAGP